MTDGCLMGSEHPLLEQGRRPVDSGQQVFAGLEAALDLPWWITIGVRPISANGAAGFDRRSDKAVKRFPAEISDSCHADAFDAFAILLSSDDDERLAGDHAAGCPARFCCTPMSFIDLYDASQTFPARAHHRLAQRYHRTVTRFLESTTSEELSYSPWMRPNGNAPVPEK